MPEKQKYKQRKDGRYEAKLTIGYKDNGRPNRITVYGKTSREVEKKINKLRYEHEHGMYANDKGLTLEDYTNKWFETYKVNRSTNTKAMYKNVIEKHINVEIGHILLKELTKSDIQKLINSRAAQHRTCEQIKLTLKQILESAITDGLILRSPCVGIELPKKPHNEKRALTEIEKQAIKAADFTPREKAFVYILYGCGLRRGEALALTKGDINIKEGILTVNKALAFDVNNPEQKDPKSHSGYREIDIPDFLVDVLKDYLKNMDILLFTTKDGGQITKSSYDKMWASILKKIEKAAFNIDKFYRVEGLTAHIFRHNYCTMLYYSDISIKKAIQLMGHTDSKMIMDIYAHLDDEKEKVRDKINKKMVL